ncbi:MAG: bifunctional methionine sulfoxide reductase protein [Pseudomonadota bacterium]
MKPGLCVEVLAPGEPKPMLQMRSRTLLATLALTVCYSLSCTTSHAEPGASTSTPTTAMQPAAAAREASEIKKENRVSNAEYKKPSQEELKRSLTPEQYTVTQQCGTEPPFRNAYWDNHAAGIYVDVTSGEPLFSSKDKFDSGTGWPSFTRPLETTNVLEKADTTHGMRRVEVRSKHGDAHLGHVFDDGPGPSGQRFCMNSASLRFVPAEKLAESGYGQYAALFPEVKQTQPAQSPPKAKAGRETAVLAGGCFWGMENIIRKIPGVLETEVGYSGGDLKTPSYEDVTTGRTGHAEAVRVVFDPAVLSYEALLGYFFRMHDPTTLNRQENDVGTQYRSAIFFESDDQRRVAEAVKEKVNKSGKFKQPVVTQIVAATQFWKAEDYHQDYLVHNPDGYNCHVLRD